MTTNADWVRRRDQLLEAQRRLDRRRRLWAGGRVPRDAPGVDDHDSWRDRIDDELYEIQDELAALERETR